MKYRFEIVYNTMQMREVAEIMRRKMDIQLRNVGIKDTLIFTTEDDHEVDKIKNDLLMAFSLSELGVISIEGEKIE